MARELDIKVVVDSAKAKQDLAGIDQQIAGVGTTSEKVGSTVATLAATLATAFTVQEVINFGKALIADADALTKMSDKTGISTDWLQRFRVAGDDAGVSLESMTSAINQMQNRLVNGDAGLVGALQRLHINVATFLDLKPEEQFILISDALKQIQNPAEQANIAMQIFGRSGAELLPVLKRGFDDVRDSAAGMSRETVAALDGLGDKLAAFARVSKGYLAEVTVSLLEATNAGGLFFDKLAQEQAQTVMLNVAKTAKELKTYAPIKPIEIPDAGELLRLDQELNNAVKRTNDAAKAATKHKEELAKVNLEQQKFILSIRELEGAAPKATFRVQSLDQALDSLGKKTKVDVKDVRDFQNELRGLYTPLDTSKEKVEDLTWMLHAASGALEDVKEDSHRFGIDIQGIFEHAVNGLSNIWSRGWSGFIDIARTATTEIISTILNTLVPGLGLIAPLIEGAVEWMGKKLAGFFSWAWHGLKSLFGFGGGPTLGELVGFQGGGGTPAGDPGGGLGRNPGGGAEPPLAGLMGGGSSNTVNIYNPTVTSRSAITQLAREVESAMSDSFRMRGPLSVRA